MELPLSNITTLQVVPLDVGRDDLEKAVDTLKSEGMDSETTTLMNEAIACVGEHSDNNHGGIDGTPQASGVQVTSLEPESISPLAECSVRPTDPLHILWPHRW